MSVRAKFLEGSKWSLFQVWGKQVAALGFFLVLAYLLAPADFGIVAFGGVMIALGEIVLDLGLTEALVQHDELSETHRSSAFWMLLLVGFLLMGLTWGATLLAEPWIQMNNLSGVIQGLSLSFVFVNGGAVYRARLKRNLDFQKIAFSSLSAVVVAGVVGVTMAWYGYGFWSLVAREVIYDFIEMIGFVLVTDWSPGFRYSLPELKELLHFGSGMVGTRVAGFFRRQADDFIIGVLLGPAVLGFYSVAYRLYLALRRLMHRAINQAAFPAFSMIQKDREKLIEGYLSTVRMTCLVALPAFAVAAILAPEVIGAFMAAKWAPAAPLLAIFCLVGVVDSFAISTGSVLLALGHSWIKMVLNLTNALVNVLGYSVGALWGVTGVAVAFLISQALYQCLPLEIVRRKLDFSWKRYVDQWGRTVCVTVLAAAGLILIKLFPPFQIHVWVELFAGVFLFLVLYVGWLRLLSPALFNELFGVLRSMISGEYNS